MIESSWDGKGGWYWKAQRRGLQIRRALKRAATLHGRSLVVGLFSFGVALSVLLSVRSNQEVALRKSELEKSFESAPEAWLTHGVDIGQLQRALDGKQLKAAAVSLRDPGLVLFTLTTGEKLSTRLANCTVASCTSGILEDLRRAGPGVSYLAADIDARTQSQKLLDGILQLMGPLISMALLVGMMTIVMRLQMRKDDARLEVDRPSIRFADVIGNAEAKTALKRVEAFLQRPDRYLAMGASVPRGVMLVGPPGTGKTLLAKALAGECGVNFIAASGSSFTSMWMGEGPAKVRRLFALARANAPCIVFIDEIDGISSRSTAAAGVGDSESNRIINAVLVEMDGFQALEDVVVVGATNLASNIDPALRRPGRFDMIVNLELPNVRERAELFKLYLRKVAHEPGLDLEELARSTPQMSPAEIANVVNKAASRAVELGSQKVARADLLATIETQQMGGEVSPIAEMLSPATKRRLAVHESGHAIVAHALKTGRVERVSIEPRGQALGVTYTSPLSEDPLHAMGALRDRLATLLAGRESELLVLGTTSTGAADDLKRATSLAVEMVSNHGCSATLGLLSVSGIPRELVGPEMQNEVLSEARGVLESAQKVCARLLSANRAAVDRMATLLLDREHLEGQILGEVLEGIAWEYEGTESER